MSDVRDEVPYPAWLEADDSESWRDDYGPDEDPAGHFRDDEAAGPPEDDDELEDYWRCDEIGDREF